MTWYSDTSSSATTPSRYYVYSAPLKIWKPKREKKKVKEEEIKQMPTDPILFDPKDLRL